MWMEAFQMGVQWRPRLVRDIFGDKPDKPEISIRSDRRSAIVAPSSRTVADNTGAIALWIEPKR